MHTIRLLIFYLMSCGLLLSCKAGSPDFIECRDDTSCGLAADGECLVNTDTGHRFCAYPDGDCDVSATRGRIRLDWLGLA